MVLPKITIYEITAITVCCWFLPCSKDFSPGSMVFLTCNLYSATPWTRLLNPYCLHWLILLEANQSR